MRITLSMQSSRAVQSCMAPADGFTAWTTTEGPQGDWRAVLDHFSRLRNFHSTALTGLRANTQTHRLVGPTDLAPLPEQSAGSALCIGPQQAAAL